MKIGFATLLGVGLLASPLCLSASAAPAPLVPLADTARPAGTISVDTVSCHCARLHHRRHVYLGAAPVYAYPDVYPAPPVGVTFRKIFGLGYL